MIRKQRNANMITNDKGYLLNAEIIQNSNVNLFDKVQIKSLTYNIDKIYLTDNITFQFLDKTRHTFLISHIKTHCRHFHF